MNIRDVITEIVRQQVHVQTRVGKVDSIDEARRSCRISIEGRPDRLDVRLQAVVSASSGLLMVPKVGSFVLVGLIENDPTSSFVTLTTDIDKVLVEIGNSTVKIDESDIRLIQGSAVVSLSGDFIELSNNTQNLKGILQDLMTAISQITVTTANGPSGTPINVPAFITLSNRIEALLS